MDPTSAVDPDQDLELTVAPPPRAGGGWGGWAISVGLHALLLLVMWGIYWVIVEPATETPPVRLATIDPPPPPKKEPEPVRELEPKVELDVAAEADTPSPITALELPVEVSQSEEQADQPEAKGREEAVSDSEMGGSGAFVAIGAGGGSAGMFGSRHGGGKKRALGRYGGSKGSESAVDAALRWFKKHQSANGMWDVLKYHENCTEAPRCEPGKFISDYATIGTTAYAVLCYLGAGYDHVTPNKYRSVVKKGLDYLMSQQRPADGLIGCQNYEHALATMALCEAFAMTGDPALKDPAQKGVDLILARQNQDPARKPNEGYGSGLGWDYIGPADRNDTSVTGWNVMALKSAHAAQLRVDQGLEGSKAWLEATWKACNPDWSKLDPYHGESRFPYTWSTTSGKVDIIAAPAPGQPMDEFKDCASIGAACAVFLGHHAGDPMLETLTNYAIAHQVPKAYPCNTYYLYYNTLAMFQVGGSKWATWNTQVRDLLVNAQRRGMGCFDGSWDLGTHMEHCGRLLSTAYCCLSLEVYYRYAQVEAKKR